MGKLFIAFLILVSNSVYACFPAKVPLQKRMGDAQTVYIGYVTGVHYYRFEALARTGKLIDAQLPEPYSLRVYVEEVIKGDGTPSIVNPKILNCGSGKAAVKDKVIVFFDGTLWYTTTFDDKTHARLLEDN